MPLSWQLSTQHNRRIIRPCQPLDQAYFDSLVSQWWRYYELCQTFARYHRNGCLYNCGRFNFKTCIQTRLVHYIGVGHLHWSSIMMLLAHWRPSWSRRKEVVGKDREQCLRVQVTKSLDTIYGLLEWIEFELFVSRILCLPKLIAFRCSWNELIFTLHPSISLVTITRATRQSVCLFDLNF